MTTKDEGLIQKFQNPTATIPQNFDSTQEIQISKNWEILKWGTKTIILCGKQYIALHGHREGIHNSTINCGNFILPILKLLSDINSNLKHHLDASSATIMVMIYWDFLILTNFPFTTSERNCDCE